MSPRFHPRVARALLGLLAAIGLAQAALADGDRLAVPLLPKYQQECAACHVAYPPGMLPAASWQRIILETAVSRPMRFAPAGATAAMGG